MRKRLFITWVTHNSRYNEKMKSLKIEKPEGYFLDMEDRVLMYNMIHKKVHDEGIKNFSLNVLSDHVHLLLMYEEDDLSDFIRKIKGSTSFAYSRVKQFGEKGEGRKNKIWARGFSKTYLDTEEHYEKAIIYTLNNHEKHGIENIYTFVNRGL